MGKSKPCKPWQRFGTSDDLRKLRGYSHETAKKEEEPKRKKVKLKLVKGGKR